MKANKETEIKEFGTIFTNHMYVMKYNKALGWYEKGLRKYEPILLDPSACALHYSQEIFEGLKAYVAEDGRVLLFRPDENALRMNSSAVRLCMPELIEGQFLQAVEELVMYEREWLPRLPGTSLYIRPTMLGVEPCLQVRPAEEYLFYIILSPVGAYYKSGFDPVSIYVAEDLVRASVGGVGNIKTGGNYAASLYAGKKAKEKGYDQVLYLDAKEHRYVEEVGSMNVFFVHNHKLITPALTGSILPGITRDSIIKLADIWGSDVEERSITIDEVIEGIVSGEITEMFGSGTAAVISPVGALNYKGKDYIINNKKVGEITKSYYEHIVNLQYGKIEDTLGWVREIGKI